MANLYDLLGVSKTATSDEIKRAYRQQARKLHPDVNPDKAAAEKFKKVSAAYEILSDTAKRRRYDAGEIDENGNPSPFGTGAYDNGGGYQNAYGGGFNGFGGGRTYRRTNINPEEFASMFGGSGFNFADLFGFGGAGGGGFQNAPRPAEDVNYDLTIDFNLSITGGETTVVLAGGKKLKIKIPAGVQSGETLRLKGQGATNSRGQTSDALIKLSVAPSALYKRQDNDVLLMVPLSLKEAVCGTKLMVPTPSGAVAVKIPPMSSSGKKLRLKGKGVSGKGDLLLALEIVLPGSDRALERFAQTWDAPPVNRGF